MARVVFHRSALLVFGLALIGFTGPAAGGDFDWRNVLGQNFVTPVKSQGNAGTCWAFASAGLLEAKYKLTRNDPLFNPDVAEQNLVCPGTMGDTGGGYPEAALNYLTSTGIVSEAELPYTQLNTSPYWPLQPGWQNRVFQSTSNLNFILANTAAIKNELKMYGPLSSYLSVDNDWYPAGGYRGAHDAVIVGYHDDPSIPQGGYWILKNQWGTTWGDQGYGKVLYGTLEAHNEVDAINGAAFYTGAMATATWQGGSAWTPGAAGNWSSAGNAYAWQNQETAAVFAASNTGSTPVTLGGTVIAHALTIAPGATGHAFSGGALTVTAGGIAAGESVTVSAPVTVGAPQTWTAAAGKHLDIRGDVHTVISTLTIDGNGDTTIHGTLDGGGAINAMGALSGNLVKNGSGTLTLGSAGRISGAATGNAGTIRFGADYAIGLCPLALNGGTLDLAGHKALLRTITLAGGSIVGSSGNALDTVGTFEMQSGMVGARLTGTAVLNKTTTGTVILGGSNTYSAGTRVTAGMLRLAADGALGSGPLSLTGGTLDMAGYSATVAGVTLAGATITGLPASRLLAAAPIHAQSGTIGASLAGAVSLDKTTSGTAVLTGDNSALTGGVNLSAGLLQCGADQAAGAGPITISGGTLNIGSYSNAVSSLTLAHGILAGTAGNQLGVSGAIELCDGAVTANLAGPAPLVKTTSGTVVLSGSNRFAGGVSATAGLLSFGGQPALPIAGSLAAGSGAYLGAGFAATQANFFDRFSKAASAGVVGLEANPVGPLDLTGFDPAVRLGSRTLAALDATNLLTPAGNAYRLGGGGGTLAIAGPLADGAVPRGLDVGTSGMLPGCTIVLSGSNSFIGGTTVSAGLLSFTTSAALPANGSISVMAGGYVGAGFVPAQAGFLDRFNKSLSQGVVGIEANPTGPLDLTGFDDAVRLGTRTAASVDGSTIVPAGATYRLGGGGGTLTVTGPLADGPGGRGLDVGTSGALPGGAVILTAPAMCSGGVSIAGATLRYGVNNALPTQNLAIAGGTLDLAGYSGTSGAVRLAGGGIFGSAGSQLTSAATFELQSGLVSAGLAGSARLIKSTTGTVTLAGTDTYLGGTTITAGRLLFSSPSALPTSGDIAISEGAYCGAAFTASQANFLTRLSPGDARGVIGFDANPTGAINLTGFADSVRVGTATAATITGPITPPGSVYRLGGGGGTLTVTTRLTGARGLDIGTSGDLPAGNVVLASPLSSIYTANTMLSAGTLTCGAKNMVPAGAGKGDFWLASDTVFNVGGFSQSVNGLSGSGNIENSAVSAVTLNVGNNDATSTFAGTIRNTAGPLSLAKVGSGTFTFAGEGTYSGGTSVSAGTLLVQGTLGGSGVSIAAGAVLGGSGRVPTISGPGLVSPGARVPGILTANALDPVLHTSLVFELGASDRPDFGHPLASQSDLLRLTGPHPIFTPLTLNNDVSVFFDTAALTPGNSFFGGLFTDEKAIFSHLIAGANWRYFIEGDGKGTHAFRGRGYYTLAEYNPSLDVAVTSLGAQATFATGSVTGSISEFVVVPEPGTLVLLLAAIVGFVVIGKHRAAR